jgi:hypothetical protein
MSDVFLSKSERMSLWRSRWRDDRFDRALVEAPQRADAVGDALLAAVRD